jgi:anti-sigma-K factor RskA
LSNGEHIRLEELELYALGTLPSTEAAALLEAHVSDCAECTANLAQARGNVALLAFAAKQEQPSASVKAELMGRVRANREAAGRQATPTTFPGQKDNDAMIRPPKPSNEWLNWLLVAAAITLAVVSVGLSLENRRITAELDKQRKAAEAMIRDHDQIEKLVTALASPDTITVKLNGPDTTTNSTGVVKYSPKEGVVLYSADLPALPPDKSYQMWLVPANGAPISAGILGPGGKPWGNLWTAQVPANTQPKAFAVTIEPVGGMPQPTGPKVLLGVI